MAMRVRVFTLRYDSGLGGFDDTAVRHFLADKELLRCSEQFFVHDGIPHIALVSLYNSEKAESVKTGKAACEIEGRARNELIPLTAEEKVLFESVREWRTERAHAEGIPVFLIASNRMLAELVRKRPASLQGIREINGFGESKIKRYGAELLSILGSGDGND